MNYKTRFCLLQTILFAKFLGSLQSKSTTPHTEESLEEIANRICLEKTGYQPLENNAYFSVVETPEYGNITLPCNYCGEKGDDDVPKIWLWKKREFGAVEKELEMGMGPNLTENRIFSMPDNSLTIQLVTVNDTGLYYCRSLVEGEFSQFHFSVDVIQNEVIVIGEKNTVVSDETEYQEYNEKVITTANEQLYEKSNDKLGKDFDKLIVKIVSEWDPWLPCDGCSGTRKRYAKCRIRPKLNIAKYPDLVEDKLSDFQKLLLGSTVISCHSLDLARLYPNLYSLTSFLPNYLRVQHCQDACVRENRMLHEARYKLDFKMDVGSSMSFICPDTNVRTKVVWRKDGSVMKAIGMPQKPQKPQEPQKPVKKKFKLPFEKKTNEYEFKRAFIDRMNVLQLCYVGNTETATYTCYVEGKPIKTFNITVVTPEETLRERQYHFLLLTVYTCTLSGAIVVMGITWAVLQRGELFRSAEPAEPRDRTVRDHLGVDLKENRPNQEAIVKEQ